MRKTEQWIWIPAEAYPQCQETMMNRSAENYKRNYKVVCFKKDKAYKKAIDSIDIRFSGDTSVSLYCGGKFTGRAPASAGGDFLTPQLPHSCHYATEITLTAEAHPEFLQGKLSFYSAVRLSEARLFEFSKGHGGFFLTAHINFADGSRAVLITDETWQACFLSEYKDIGSYDNSDSLELWVNAERIPNIWLCETAPIPPCSEKRLDLGTISLAAGEKKEAVLPLDMIYAGYPVIKAITNGEVKVTVECREWKENGSEIFCRFAKSGEYECKELHSAGELVINAENLSKNEAFLQIGFITSCYPVTVRTYTETSDSELNDVFKICAHTLQYCRQTLHLDSPRHCELLACTGDYYIESLMTAFTFGDQKLSAFDIRRTAELLRYRDGKMFHTTYSLIWVLMLWDVYMLTGEKELLYDCLDALEILLRRFKTYIGETGLIETPPSFMFVDWLFPDGISMHHPPKALGQTCLNMFFYGALEAAVKIYGETGINANETKKDAKSIKSAIIKHLYDDKKKLFFEGLNTPTPEKLVYEDMPQNVTKRYYMKHSNILAAYFGILSKDECRNLLRKIIPDKTMPDVQPYFCHFLLEAVYRNDLREEFTLSILNLWKAPVAECPKGLAEGFCKPDPTYSFDHSHAWGGTPAWSLPLALCGMEIQKAGMSRLKFKPSLLGLKFANIRIPAPQGIITIKLSENSAPVIDAPQGIEIIIQHMQNTKQA